MDEIINTILEMKIWILLGVVGILTWLAKLSLQRILSKIDSIVSQLTQMNISLEKTITKLNTADERITAINARVKVLEDDVKEIEIKCASKQCNHEK